MGSGKVFYRLFCAVFAVVAVLLLNLRSAAAGPKDSDLTSAAQKIACAAEALLRVPPHARDGIGNHRTNGNPGCFIRSCNDADINSCPKCVQKAVTVAGCYTWQWYFSSCLEQLLGKPFRPDEGHAKKIAILDAATENCASRCTNLCGNSTVGETIRNQLKGMKERFPKPGISKPTGGKFLKALFILSIAATAAGAADIVVDFAAGEFPVGKLT